MIAKSAIIGSGAKIGLNVEIGEFCIIGDDVEIGDNCKLYNNVTIAGHTKLGSGNKVFPCAVLGTPPQDLKYNGEVVELIIGDNNIIREFAMFNPGTATGAEKTIIGSNNLFMAYTHIAHDCIVGNNCILANCATLGGHVEVGDFVNIGGLCAVHQFVKIGGGVMLAGYSSLTQDLPPYSMAEGNRAIIRGLNRHRMRKILSREQIDSISLLYKNLFSGSAPIKEIATRELEKRNLDIEIEKICNFVINSARGIPFIRGGQGEKTDE